MANNAVLYVFVENANAESLEGTTVTASSKGARRGLRLKDVGTGQYTRPGLAPGEFSIRISRRGYQTEIYDVTLKPGPNSVSAVLGRRNQPYYYADGQKIYFQPDEESFLVVVEGIGAQRATQDVVSALALTSDDLSESSSSGQPDEETCFLCVHFPADKPMDRETMSGVVGELEAQGMTVVPALVVKRGDGAPQGLTNDLTVQFREGVTGEQVGDIAAAVGLQVRRVLKALPNSYVLTSNELPSYSILETAEALLLNHPVKAAEPDLLSRLETDQFTPNDPLYNLLPHLPLTNCDDAWESLGEFLGAALRGGSPDICIAVFDPNGVAPNHPDLTANLSDGVSKLITSFNFRNMTTQTVAGLSGDHGTKCSGSATAAFNNSRGTVGVAPNCRLIGARLPSPATGVMMADAFMWSVGIDNGNTNPSFPALPAQPADVISNSWGASNAALSNVLRNAFDRITDDARDGRGAVIVFSIGNLGYVQFSNIRRFAAYERTIAVGASINVNPTSPVNSVHSDPNGNTNNLSAVTDRRAFFNPFGPEMDIVAPTHTCYQAGSGALVDPVTSTVRVGTGTLDGCPGAASCQDYDTTFGGTSHSSPTVAGAAALVLSGNPVLSWDEVRGILRRTAVRIHANNSNSVGQYVDNDGDGVTEFSQWYGYGRLDVDGAVLESTKLLTAMYLLFRPISG